MSKKWKYIDKFIRRIDAIEICAICVDKKESHRDVFRVLEERKVGREKLFVNLKLTNLLTEEGHS